MSSYRAKLFLSVAMVAFVVTANASDGPSAVKETIQISGGRLAVQSLPDRQVYTVEHDLQASGGTLSNVLRNLPSVDVDVEGGVSLRGDSNVTILIDGKSSALLSGDRGEALEQVSADSIDRIEVMTSPGAQFKAQGSGGIINIISKKTEDNGQTGTIRVSMGNDGRYSVSASGAKAFGPVRLNGAAGIRRDVRYRTGSDVRTGSNTSQETTSSKSPRSVVTAKLGADWEISEINSLESAVNFNHRTSWITSQEAALPSMGTPYIRVGAGPSRRDALQSSLDFTHSFGKDEELKLEFGQGYDWEYKKIDYRNHFAGTLETQDWRQERSIEMETEAGISYKVTLANGIALHTGYRYEDENNSYINLAMERDPATALWKADGDYTSHFKLYEGLHALYTNVEGKLGSFNLSAGLRGEYLDISTRLVTSGEAGEHVYKNLFPSLHAGYDFSDTNKLSVGYSRRENIPDDDDLNPAREYHSALSVGGGNAGLKPEITDSFETALRHVGEAGELTLTAYHRRTHNGFTEVSRALADGVLLTTKDNLAKRNTSGIELAMNGELARILSIRSSANLGYSEIDPGALSTGRKRSGMTVGGKAGFDLKLTRDDLLQFNLAYSGRQLLPQGRQLPVLTANAAWQHVITPQLSAVASVSNLFDSQKRKTILDTAGTHDEAVSRLPGRILFFGLTYNFGGARQDDKATDTGAEED